jgi:hypothetical protein
LLLQEVTTRFPDVSPGDTTYASAGGLSQALRRAMAAHGQHEARTGQADPNWRTGTPCTWCRRGWDGVADVSDYDVIVFGAPGEAVIY